MSLPAPCTVQVPALSDWLRRLHPQGFVAQALGFTSGLFGGMAGNQGGLRAGALLAFDLSPAALVATEGGILLTLVKDYPPSFFISSISFALYLVARIVGSRNLSRRSADVRTGVTITPASVAGQTR